MTKSRVAAHPRAHRDQEMLEVALRRTIALYREPSARRTLRENGMAAEVSWRGPARSYAALHRELVGARA